jgi:adenylate cyclase
MQLVDTSNGRLLWSERYDEAPREVFAVQDDIVRHIANALFIRVWKIEAAQATAKPPGNLEAYELTLRGSSLYLQFKRLTNAQARSLFEQALRLDGAYPPALVGLGWVDVFSSDQGWTEDREAALGRAEALARRAIAINGEDANAHALLGTVLVRQGHATQATDESRTAIRLNPSSSDSYEALGDVLLWSGDPQGSSEAREMALKLNPNLGAGTLVTLG